MCVNLCIPNNGPLTGHVTVKQLNFYFDRLISSPMAMSFTFCNTNLINSIENTVSVKRSAKNHFERDN